MKATRTTGHSSRSAADAARRLGWMDLHSGHRGFLRTGRPYPQGDQATWVSDREPGDSSHGEGSGRTCALSRQPTADNCWRLAPAHFGGNNYANAGFQCRHR
jgi:hypothetical protein